MKKIFFPFLLLSLFLIADAASAQTLSPEQHITVNKLFKKKGEVYFSFTIQSRADIETITKIISIDDVKGLNVWAYANKQGFEQFLALNIPYTILPNPNQLQNAKTKNSTSLMQLRAWSAYPTYPAYEAIMSQFVTDHPSLCRLVNIGTLPSGRKLLVLKITDNPDVHENEPQFLYTSTMHGDETAGYVGMLNYIDYLLSNYGTDARVTNLVNNMEIWICPLANPDGTYAGGNTTVTGATRYNANNIDLNRNYPDPQAGIHPDGNAWQPETMAFMAFADSMNFVMGANFHGGAEVANYPWDTWAAPTVDNNWWVRESKKYADTVFANSPSGYFTSVTSTGYTNGFAWYQVTGGRQDYMNYYKHCREFTVELSNTKILGAGSLTSNFNYNIRSWLNYMEESLHGIRGIIKDACTNQPIRAKVFVNSHDVDSSFVYSTADVGNYHRPIYPGTYSVTFSAPGYASQTISGITVVNGSATVVNVSLSPVAPTANFSATLASTCGGDVQFTDLSGSASGWAWDFGDGNFSSLQNPAHSYASSGSYTVKLTVSNCAGADSLIRVSYVNVTVADAPVVTNDSATICGPTSLNLAATASGIVNWYDASTGGTLVHTGATYTTPVLTSTTTYYVENDIGGGPQYVGAVDNTIGAGGYFTAASYHYLKFTASSAFKLVSVWVNANTAGNRTVELRNSAGTVLQSAVINIPAGSSRITLNFDVPVGTDLQLGLAGGSNMYRNSSGGNYPYSIGGIVSITGNSAANLAYYYYYYDWEITQSCTSARVAVTGIINPTTPASASITTMDSVVCAGTMSTFTANAVNGGTVPSYQWSVNGGSVGTNSPNYTASLNDGDVVNCVVTSSNVCASGSPSLTNSISMQVNAVPSTPTVIQSGDTLYSSAASGNQWYDYSSGLIAGATNNYYVPAVNGNYYVLVDGGSGCISDSSNVVAYVASGIAQSTMNTSFGLYPNPGDNEIQIQLANANGAAVKLEIVDAIGRVVYTRITNEKAIQVSSVGFANGLYLVRISDGNSVSMQRLVVKHR